MRLLNSEAMKDKAAAMIVVSNASRILGRRSPIIKRHLYFRAAFFCSGVSSLVFSSAGISISTFPLWSIEVVSAGLIPCCVVMEPLFPMRSPSLGSGKASIVHIGDRQLYPTVR